MLPNTIHYFQIFFIMSLQVSPPKSPSSASSLRIRTNQYPTRYYNPTLVPTFESKENENQWFLLTKHIDWLKPIISSLAPHDETMNSLDINKCVRRTFKRASLDIDNVMGLPTYKPLVFEFLASFTVKHGEKMYDENCAWEFRMQNINFRWSRKEATRNLGFPLFGVPAKATLNQRLSTWKKLTGQDHMGLNNSPYAFTCKAWFYIHCLISTNINCKPESVDTVTIQDLNILHALSEECPVDWFDIFSERFLRMREHNSNLSYVGCTSLISFIAKTCGFQFCYHPDKYRELDHACLKKMRLLRSEYRGTYRPIIIRDTSLTDVSEEEDDTNTIGKEKGECSKSPEKKRKVEFNVGKMPEEFPWKELRKVTIYEL